MLTVLYVVANQRRELLRQIVARLRVICVGGKVDVGRVVVDMIDHRFSIVGEFPQQGVNTVNRLLLPRRGSLPGFVKLGEELSGLVDMVLYLAKFTRVALPAQVFCHHPRG